MRADVHYIHTPQRAPPLVQIVDLVDACLDDVEDGHEASEIGDAWAATSSLPSAFCPDMLEEKSFTIDAADEFHTRQATRSVHRLLHKLDNSALHTEFHLTRARSADEFEV